MSEEIIEIEPEIESEPIEDNQVPVCEDFRCPVQQFEEDPDEEPTITHVFVLKSGEIIYANKSIELESQLPSGDIEIIIAVDAMDFPEDEDRSIITFTKDNLDYTQEWYNKENWNVLMRAAFCSKCEQITKYHAESHMFA